MILYRPVGLQELELIYDSGMKAFPARLPQQPIFYPVLNLEYARQIASDWNSQSGQLAGYVTEFKAEEGYISQFEKHTVGGSQHQELWIPAEELEEFNKHIVGHIKVLEAHFGDKFQGVIPEKFSLQGKDAVAQFTVLTDLYLYKRMEFYLEIKRNHKAVFLNYPFWQNYAFKNPGLKEKILQAIKEAWLTSFPQFPLPLPPPFPEEIPPAKQTDSPAQHLAKPISEDVEPVDGTDAHAQHSVNPVHEDAPPIKKIDSPSFVDRAREDVTPVKQSDSRPEATPLPEETTVPKQTDSHFMKGIQLGLGEKYVEAVDELSKAVEEDSDDVVAQTSLGVALHRLGEEDRALACYETALRIDPIYAEAHYFRANILYSRGNVREAIAGYTLAIGLKPDLIEAHQKPAPQDRLTDYTRSPAEMYWIAKPAHRILNLNKLLEANPGGAHRFKERAAEYYRLRNYAQAIADYNSFLAKQPDDGSALHLRGLAYEQLGQLERALEDYQKALSIHPQLSNVYINRGVTFGKMGNYRQSIDSFTEGIRLAPKNPDGYFNRGTAYFQLGDFEAAIADFSMVIQLSTQDEDAYYWRGMSNEQAGRQQEAIADYKQFLAISQNAEAKEQVEQKLSQWSVAKQDVVNRQRTPQEDRQTANKVSSEEPDQSFDLYDLIVTLGERALNSTWFGSAVNCYGEGAEQLYALTDQNKPIDGRDFLQITAGIRQTVEGDFQAFDPGADAPWIFLRAWDGSGFYVETNDPRIKKHLQTHIPELEEVEGAQPPYEGLFMRI